MAKSKPAKATTEGQGRRRLLWFLLLWAAGVATLGVVAYPLRWILQAIYGS